MNLLDMIKYFFYSDRKSSKANDKLDDRINNMVFNSISFGDIILLKYNLINKGGISLFNTNDIYVVVGKTEDKLICCHCTNIDGNRGTLSLKEEAYFFNKKPFVNILQKKIVEDMSLIKKVGTLISDDRERLKKYLEFNNVYNREVHDKKKNKIEYNAKISIRDIVKIGGWHYLVVDSNKDSFKVLCLNDYDNNRNLDDIDFERMEFINRKAYEYVDTVSKSQYMSMMKKYYKYTELKNSNKNKILKKGYIVRYKDKLYYVYNVSSSLANAFEIIKEDDSNLLIIADKPYKPCFANDIIINAKKDDYIILEIASHVEKEKINTHKKKYFSDKGIIKKINNNCFNVGDIIECDDIYGVNLIVIGVCDDKIITISLPNFINDKIINYYEFDINGSSLRLSNNVKKEDLMIVKENIDYFNKLHKDVKTRKKVKNDVK